MMDMEACWEWPGFHRKSDGRPTVSGEYVYRMIYVAAGGQVEDGQPLHHTCHMPWCVNPLHVQPMEQDAHAREHEWGGDWGQRDKTTCPQGHAYNEENTYIYMRNGKPERHCRVCRLAAKQRHRDKVRGKD